jgi:hypothetical protein
MKNEFLHRKKQQKLKEKVFAMTGAFEFVSERMGRSRKSIIGYSLQ